MFHILRQLMSARDMEVNTFSQAKNRRKNNFTESIPQKSAAAAGGQASFG
jgi:hypothetical protein